MPLPEADAPVGPPPRAGSPRRDPVLLLVVAGALLVLRIVFALRGAAAPAKPDSAPLSGPEAMRWRTLESGLAESRASGRPVLYDFTADWCPPCRRMKQELFADPNAAATLEGGFVPVRVLDRQREAGHNERWVDSLQAVYRVNAFPTLVVTGPRGEGELRRTEGFMGREATLAQLGASGVSIRFGGPAQAPPGGR